MYTQFHLQLFEKTKHYPGLISNLSFFKTWQDPKDFYTISKDQRKVLQSSYSNLSVPPEAGNYWIWFGAYDKYTKSPRYNNKPVARILYEATIGQVTGGNICGKFNETHSDVNPNKYFPKIGIPILELMQQYQNRIGGVAGSAELVIKAQHKAKLDKGIEDCVAEVTRLFTPGVIDTKEMFKKAAPGMGFPLIIMDAALDRLPHLPWKPDGFYNET